MKLCRYGPAGKERPGLIASDGALRDLSSAVADITPAELSSEGLARLAALDTQSLETVEGDVRFGIPFSGTRQFLAIGLNYADHAKESGGDFPTEPVIFSKAISCLNGPNDEIVLPRGSSKTDWEVELGVVISSPAYYVSEEDALSHIAGYCVVNDVSEREFQRERGGTWCKGKGCPTFGPVGPWLVTSDEIGDPQKLDLWLDVNGLRMQAGRTSQMIFPVAELVSYVSEFIALQPGDIITTGTPAGVGLGQKPAPVFLKPGDVVTLGIEKLGTQRQQVVKWSREAALA